MIVYILYVIAALVAAFLLSAKTDRKALSFLLIFWILTQPILNTVLLIQTPGLGFDFQPNRILLLLLVPYLFFAGIGGRGTIKRPPFEKYIYIYLGIVFISLVFNFGIIRKQNLAVVPLEILTFLVVYTAAKRHATESFFESIINAIILMAVASALISLIQIGINSEFLKTGDPRIAFGNVVRSTGIFQSEYELGYFQILAIMISMFKLKGSAWRFRLILLLLASLLTTFHRLDLLILMACLASYVWFFGKPSQKVASYGAVVFAIFVVAASYVILEPLIGKSEFVLQRLQEDTVSGRFKQYGVILQALPDFAFVGMGDYTSKAYYALMEKAHMVRAIEGGTANWHREAYVVHNGYLEVAALYGAFAMTAFFALLISMLRYFKKINHIKFRYSIVPFYAVLIWMLANISNGVSTFRIYFVLLLAILAGSMISMQRISTRRQLKNPLDAKASMH
jgi:hypothetical protein